MNSFFQSRKLEKVKPFCIALQQLDGGTKATGVLLVQHICDDDDNDRRRRHSKIGGLKMSSEQDYGGAVKRSSTPGP